MNNELPTISYASRRNVPNPTATPSKPPILPKLSTICDLIMQNKANFPDDQMNLSTFLTKDYENIANSKRGQSKPNTNPIYCGVASGKAGSNPKQSQSKPI